jgi:hypothetical protein
LISASISSVAMGGIAAGTIFCRAACIFPTRAAASRSRRIASIERRRGSRKQSYGRVQLRVGADSSGNQRRGDPRRAFPDEAAPSQNAREIHRSLPVPLPVPDLVRRGCGAGAIGVSA